MNQQIIRVAVANRGEIASRVFATCRRLGIETLAFASDADANLPYVADADTAVRLPGNTPAETYLDIDAIIGHTRGWGGQAVHPGYGFLSERADFARAVLDAGLVWLGPPSEAIELMGDKIRAKAAVAAAGVPVLEDVDGAAPPADLRMPVLVKASAGGGGRGMRVVRSLEDLPAAIETASAEAASAFGDGTVFVEPYIERSRHIEVQILADAHGAVVAIGDRDCSLQRRHQKVIEEAPAPGLSDEVRTRLHEAAVAAAQAADYVSAGTVEFLFDVDTDEFFFLEMNTRLQVEHPVTECVTGIDLVAAQIAIAEGAHVADILPVDANGRMPAPKGHAIEARLYAEDVVADYAPQAGTLSRIDVPHEVSFEVPDRYGLRWDAGYASGSTVSTFYDAMLGKIIAWAPDRAAALRMLGGALMRSRLHGVQTNASLLWMLAMASDSSEWTTATLPAMDISGADEPVGPELAPIVAAVALAERSREERLVQRGVPLGWRNVPSVPQQTAFAVPGQDDPVVVRWWHTRDGYSFPDYQPPVPELTLRVVEASPTRVVYDSGSYREVVEVTHAPDGWLYLDGARGHHFRVKPLPRFTDPADQVAPGSLTAPMPGTVISVAVATGDEVTAGKTVLVLEAMKMQHTVAAPADGTITELHVSIGQQVAAGEVLAVVTTDSTNEPEEQS